MAHLSMLMHAHGIPSRARVARVLRYIEEYLGL